MTTVSAQAHAHEWATYTDDDLTRRLSDLSGDAAKILHRALDDDRRSLTQHERDEIAGMDETAELISAELERRHSHTDDDRRQRVQLVQRELGRMREDGRAGEIATGLRANFREAERRAQDGVGHRFSLGDYAEGLVLLERSTTTALAGASQSVSAPAATGDSFGIWLPRESRSVNLRQKPGTRLEAAQYGANTAVSSTAEGDDKPALDPTGPDTDTVSPYAVQSNVTIQSEMSGRGVEQFTWAGTRKVRRSVNDAYVTAMIAAGGTPVAFATDAATSVDTALATMMGTAATVPDLIVCGADVFPALAQAGGDDATDAFPSFRGIRLVASSVAGLAGHALVIDGSSVEYSMSPVEVRSQPQVISNSTDVVVEVWFAVVAHGASGVILQDCVTP